MDRIVLIGVGGAVGSICRYLVSGFVQDRSGSISFPFGTLAVNVLGCLFIGILSELATFEKAHVRFYRNKPHS